MTILKLCQDKREWDSYMLDHGSHPLQLWGWGDVKASHGWEAYRLFFYNDEHETLGAVQVLVKRLPWPFRSISYVPRGPVVDEKYRFELLETLADFVKKNYHSVSLTIEPDETEYSVPEDWIKSQNHILPSQTIILDLEKSESDLLAVMAKKTRQYIRKSDAEATVIKRVKNREDLAKCLGIYHDTAVRAGFDLHSDSYYMDVYDKMGEHAPIFAVYNDDQPIAFLWLAISADTAYELYGGMNELGQQLRSNYALKWNVIKKCKEWGLKRYDFGGLIEGGVSTFKLGWAEGESELVGTYSKPLSVFYGLWVNAFPAAKKALRKVKSIFRKR